VRGRHRAASKKRFWQESVTAYSGLTPPFLGPADFLGSFNPRQREATEGLQSTFGGLVAIGLAGGRSHPAHGVQAWMA
jgi:hypothetical protein